MTTPILQLLLAIALWGFIVPPLINASNTFLVVGGFAVSALAAFFAWKAIVNFITYFKS